MVFFWLGPKEKERRRFDTKLGLIAFASCKRFNGYIYGKYAKTYFLGNYWRCYVVRIKHREPKPRYIYSSLACLQLYRRLPKNETISAREIEKMYSSQLTTWNSIVIQRRRQRRCICKHIRMCSMWACVFTVFMVKWTLVALSISLLRW